MHLALGIFITEDIKITKQNKKYKIKNKYKNNNNNNNHRDLSNVVGIGRRMGYTTAFICCATCWSTRTV